MAEETRVYRLGERLAVNIPSSVLPPAKVESVEEVIEEPAKQIETIEYINALVRVYSDGVRLLLTPTGETPFSFLSYVGFDPYMPIQVKPYRSKNWFNAHLYHDYYGRVWIPKSFVKAMKMEKRTFYPVRIRGYSKPVYEKKLIRKRIRRVFINYFGVDYFAEEYGIDKWRWLIPEDIVGYPNLVLALEQGYYPYCELHQLGVGTIHADVFFNMPDAAIVSKTSMVAYRTMSVRNYTATVHISYPFLAEIRATYVTTVPKAFYKEPSMSIEKALAITVYNLLQHFFQPASPELPYSKLSYAEYKNKVHYTQQKLYLPNEYPLVTETPELLVEGEESNIEISYGEIPDTPYGRDNHFYRCIKYVRVVNEYSYKYRQKMKSEYEYHDDQITQTIQGIDAVEIDGQGFVWKAGIRKNGMI